MTTRNSENEIQALQTTKGTMMLRLKDCDAL